MKSVSRLKLLIDLGMTALLFCQMAYLRLGEELHEWTGAALFGLFLLHHLLNRQWHRNLLRGPYTPLRALSLLVNLMLLVCMAGLMVSGVMLSREVFAFLPLQGGMGFARILHLLCSYWGFGAMSLHLGLPGGTVLGALGRMVPPRLRGWGRVFAALWAAAGLWAFFKNDLAAYMLLQNTFVFFDLEQPLALFFAEYLAMMGAWGCLGWLLVCLARKRARRAPEKPEHP